MIPEGYAQVTAHMHTTDNAVTADLVFGIQNIPDVDVVALGELVRLSLNGWTTLSANLCNTWAFTTALVKMGPDDTGPATEVPITLGGSNVSAASPPNVAYLLKKITGFGGRRGRGRMYIPGVPEPAVDANGNLAAGWQAAMNAVGADLIAELDGRDIPMVVLHSQPRPPAGPIVLPDPYPVLTLAADAKTATQRRRLRR